MCHSSVLAKRQEPAVAGESYHIAWTVHLGYRHGVLHRPNEGYVKADTREIKCAICIEGSQPVRLSNLSLFSRLRFGLPASTPALFAMGEEEDMLEFADGRVFPLRKFADKKIVLELMAIPASAADEQSFESGTPAPVHSAALA